MNAEIIISLPWTLNTNANENPEDERGYLTVVSMSSDYWLAQQPTHTRTFSARNADNYAWMAASSKRLGQFDEADKMQQIYNYFNSLDKCAGIHYSGPNSIPGTCNADVWPEAQPKLIKTTWSSWPGEPLPYTLVENF